MQQCKWALVRGNRVLMLTSYCALLVCRILQWAWQHAQCMSVCETTSMKSDMTCHARCKHIGKGDHLQAMERPHKHRGSRSDQHKVNSDGYRLKFVCLQQIMLCAAIQTQSPHMQDSERVKHDCCVAVALHTHTPPHHRLPPVYARLHTPHSPLSCPAG